MRFKAYTHLFSHEVQRNCPDKTHEVQDTSLPPCKVQGICPPILTHEQDHTGIPDLTKILGSQTV